MTEYVVRGDEETYNDKGEIESEKIIQWIKISANSLEEAIEEGRKQLQKNVCTARLTKPIEKMYVVRVDLVFDETGRDIKYRSEKIKKQDEERKNEKFDLQAAIADGCCIDESGAGTCGG